MRAHYLQHVTFEDIGSIESWLKINGYEISNTKLFEAADFPSLEDIDLFVIMGGPMSVNDEDKYPWLIREKKFIYEAIKSDKAVLGICLGAQLIAAALGAMVYQNPMKEIGWFPVCGIPTSDKSVFCFPESLKVFHWHGETFDLPAGATRLAASAACKNQGFQLGKKVIALQFHLETTPESARLLVHNCREELVPGAFIQTDDEILSVGPETYQLINHFMDNILISLSGLQ
jgi:GMP synthase-like glutamine amidotransferase